MTADTGRILLVAPLPLRFELTQDDPYRNMPLSRVKSFILPLHLATVAGITPPDWEVRIWDESVHGRLDRGTLPAGFDLVGLTGYTAHLPRAVEIANICRQQGLPVVIGGAGISSLPHRYHQHFDAIFIGEAEETWPAFLADFRAGRHRHVYRQVTPVDLGTSPPPVWDSLADRLDNYLLGAVQTSRGCPFNCEFCDVSYLFGHRFRHKGVAQVVAELETLARLGIRRVVVCDDNFAGNPSYTKELLREIIAFNRTLARPMGFATEVSINVARDDELLTLLADANFVEIFVGIESPNKESLREANKLHNFKSDLVADINKIQSYGMAVRGSLIVGFDHDGPDIFDQHFHFVQESRLMVPSIRVLMAPPGTRLWQRMRREGRLLATEHEGRFYGNPGTTNIVPRSMSRHQLLTGYLDLIDRVYDWDNFSRRAKGFIDGVRRRPAPANLRHHWRRLVQFALFMFRRMDPKARRAALAILGHGLRRAPYMLPRLTGFIMRQYGYANRPQLRRAIEELIRRDGEGREEPRLAVDETVIPDGFRQAWPQLLPDLYRFLHQRLADGRATEEAVIQVVDRFLLYEDGGGLSPAAMGQRLHQLATEETKDRGATAAAGPPPPMDPILAERILKAVEQDLLMAKAA